MSLTDRPTGRPAAVAKTPELVPVPSYRQIVDLAELVGDGSLSLQQRRLVSRLVEQLGFSLRVALLHHAGWWEPLADTDDQCVRRLETPRG